MLNKLPIIRCGGRTTPPYYIGTVLENRLGLQVCRIVGKSLTRKLRKKSSSEAIRPYLETLDRDGVLAIENFLDDGQLAAVVDEFEKANAGCELKAYKNVENARLFRCQLRVSDVPERYATIRDIFEYNALLNDIASAMIRRDLKQHPDIVLDTYQCANVHGIDNDIENILHADLHVPTVKMFFYLSSADSENGAFVFANGSHKLTRTRLVHEYRFSIRQAKLRSNGSVPGALLERRGSEVRNTISNAVLERMKVSETQICVKPNTLVVANNMGFHRRGEFTCERPRKALLINYRNAEPLYW